jgi:hypothetical protein
METSGFEAVLDFFLCLVVFVQCFFEECAGSKIVFCSLCMAWFFRRLACMPKKPMHVRLLIPQ